MDDVDVLYKGRPHDDVLVVICRIHGAPAQKSTLVRLRWRHIDLERRVKAEWIFVEVWTQNGWQRLFDHQRIDPNDMRISTKEEEIAELTWVVKRLLSSERPISASEDPIDRMYREAFQEEEA